jgi:hypothetical protein
MNARIMVKDQGKSNIYRKVDKKEERETIFKSPVPTILTF